MTVDLGTDISTPSGLNGIDLDPTFSLVSDEAQLGQALVRRLHTRRGTLIRNPSYGRDLAGLLNDQAPRTATVAAWIEAECQADERVESADAAVTFTRASGVLRAVVSVRTRANTTFRLTLAVSSVTVELLALDRT